ncbi:uncharacterized protein IWZ02DRAFT_290919 [Phyllosticta citriasiana]|uniref:uncharacterized protein n=1 Tax=Phyllosticta citriasiana TaxID=595635 RepID=UPI0030FD7DAA
MDGPVVASVLSSALSHAPFEGALTDRNGGGSNSGAGMCEKRLSLPANPSALHALQPCIQPVRTRGAAGILFIDLRRLLSASLGCAGCCFRDAAAYPTFFRLRVFGFFLVCFVLFCLGWGVERVEQGGAEKPKCHRDQNSGRPTDRQAGPRYKASEQSSEAAQAQARHQCTPSARPSACGRQLWADSSVGKQADRESPEVQISFRRHWRQCWQPLRRVW